jgi:hypothetical protein
VTGRHLWGRNHDTDTVGRDVLSPAERRIIRRDDHHESVAREGRCFTDETLVPDALHLEVVGGSEDAGRSPLGDLNGQRG